MSLIATTWVDVPVSCVHVQKMCFEHMLSRSKFVLTKILTQLFAESVPSLRPAGVCSSVSFQILVSICGVLVCESNQNRVNFGTLFPASSDRNHQENTFVEIYLESDKKFQQSVCGKLIHFVQQEEKVQQFTLFLDVLHQPNTALPVILKHGDGSVRWHKNGQCVTLPRSGM